MKVTCTGRRVTLKPSFIENAEKRLAKLDKFFPDAAQAQVTVTVEKSGQTVEIMLRSKDLAMRAEKTDERMEDALADAVDLLTRRVVKYRKRLGTKLTAAAAEIPAGWRSWRRAGCPPFSWKRRKSWNRKNLRDFPS